MHVLETSALILLVFSAAGLVAALAAAIVTADKLAGAWHYGEPTARGRKPRGSRCANAGRRPKRSRDSPVVCSRKHR
jgi:hypothetical protein